jgi:phosphate-selective porin OprO/OprP
VKVTQDVTRVNGPTTRSDSLDVDAWHLQFSWFVTGEEESFRGFTPASTFRLGESWGAVELVARYHELSIDDAAFAGGADSFANPDTAARKARAAGLGVNWYLNQAVKLSVNYEQTRFTGGAAGGADRPDEKALLTRASISF